MDLSLVLLEDILKEFKKRYKAYIFSYKNSLDKDTDVTIHHFHGGKSTCIGLAEELKHGLLNNEDVTEDDTD